MKANELRIGNYVQHKHGGGIIETVVEPHLAPQFWKSIEGTYEPIPITEEWLVNLELQEAHYGTRRNPRYNLPGYGYEIHLSDDTEHGVYFEGNCMTYIKYVHQLQNLIFALTGEEITIKEQHHG